MSVRVYISSYIGNIQYRYYTCILLIWQNETGKFLGKNKDFTDICLTIKFS